MPEKQKQSDIEQRCVDTVRMLAVDMVEKAASGHPGMPLGAAPMAHVLWSRHLCHNPKNPTWFNRDRFILSAGHGSALLYALLHLHGYALPMEELKSFRQWRSKTPGHPEFRHTPGVEVTTGPLGQGFAMGVGMALAERYLAAQFNRDTLELIDHRVYAIVSDGDLMEGITAEAASLAGHLQLGKLVYLYDDNGISIDGQTTLAFTEDVAERFRAYGWQVIEVADGNDLAAIDQAINQAKDDAQRPSLIACKTNIGFGSPKQDSSAAHGEPLGQEAMRTTREHFGWPPETFVVGDDVRAHMSLQIERGAAAEEAWNKTLATYRQRFPEDVAQFSAQLTGDLPQALIDTWWEALPQFGAGDPPIATRSASGKVINALAKQLPQLIGGSADLAPSNKTLINDGGDQQGDRPGGRNLRFGVREQAMGAITNGMAVHGGVLPFCATFFVFSDYMRPMLRMAAIMQAPAVFVFTHDSIGVGEDGPTHQPIEQLMSLRLIPDLQVVRPADANETVAAWRVALNDRRPTALVLTRQNLPVLELERRAIGEGVAKGAYVVRDRGETPQILILASGSEVHLALTVQEALHAKGTAARVVSMPSWELFARQSQAYRDSVIPPQIDRRVAIEAGTTLGWERWVGRDGLIVGIDHFGASAPGALLMEKFGFSTDAVVARISEAYGC